MEATLPKPIGRQGSWFAVWEGEELPCVHKHWTNKRWPGYLDPNCDDRPEWPAFLAALREGKRAILTTSKIPANGGSWRRDKYLAIWTIDDVKVEGTALMFRFVDKLVEFKNT